MAQVNYARLGVAVLIGLALAVATALHTLSMLAQRNSPEQAVALFPANGAARELAAFREFSENVADPAQIQLAAAAVRDDALAAWRSDPTSAKALVLLSLAMTEPSARQDAALSASRINRRDLALQGAVLEAHIERDDFENVVETLDQILRVHTSRASEFFPLLGEALRDERTTPVFARLLDGSSPWHESFLSTYALGQDDLLPQLAQLRAQRDLGDEAYDRRLVDRLARTGRFAEASALYSLLRSDAGRALPAAASGAQVIDWAADYPPFEWRFVDQPDFRAQESRDGERLELFARPGKGGIMARRIVAVPTSAFAIKVDFTAESPSDGQAVRLELSCPELEKVLLAQALEEGANTIEVRNAPGCDTVQIAIIARAFSGQPTLRSELSRISIESR
ncbi:hypothetical protein [Erythrobacter sp. THAF29]|uniref:hypothetical protein n=1 Tax=Erythrobacter sp. THAF29 TaxID=2587851 RepID=UPI001267B528|nr:hypothetical protein [Erythrobacter sp. THAF29]QFT76301.1 hypothetical protein FIU90_01980 [Erythrobacter sp. THAF29]